MNARHEAYVFIIVFIHLSQFNEAEKDVKISLWWLGNEILSTFCFDSSNHV